MTVQLLGEPSIAFTGLCSSTAKRRGTVQRADGDDDTLAASTVDGAVVASVVLLVAPVAAVAVAVLSRAVGSMANVMSRSLESPGCQVTQPEPPP